MIRAWKRDLEIILTSQKLHKSLTFGTNWKKGENDFTIRVSGHKYLASMKDNFTIDIENLTYSEVVQLIDGEYYDVEIKAGYKDIGAQTIFKGGVQYISNILGDRKSNTVKIFCANKLVAKFGQSKINLTLNSGINMYGALSTINKRVGLGNVKISSELKQRIIKDTTTVRTNFANFLDNFTKNNNLIINADSSLNTDYNLWSPRSQEKIIVLRDDAFVLTGGYPTFNSEGAHLMLIPTYNFMPGDIIKLDNSILDLGISSSSEISSNAAYYLDNDGKYYITEISYDLNNRNSNFQLSILAKSYTYYKQLQNLAR